MSNLYFDSNYLQLCNEKTLQTNRKGFFLDFANGLSDSVGEKWIKNTFSKLHTDKERFRLIYQNEKIKSYIIEFLSNVQEFYRKKCREGAETCLKNEKKEERAPENIKRLALLSQAVIKAPQNTEMYAVALLQRATLLITLNKYTLALSDLQLAQKSNLPIKYKAEIFWKLGICYKAKNEDNQAQVAFKLAEKLFDNNKQSIRLLHESMKIKYVEDKQADKVPPTISSPNKKYPHASSKITVKNTPEQGNYAVAKSAIESGETLVVEPPYAACLQPDRFGTHCHHCFARLVAPIGCPDCSSLAFCTQQCRDTALGSYHRFECKFLDLIIGSGMSVLSQMALRMITQCTLERNLEIWRNRGKERIYSLCTNAEMRTGLDFLHRCIMAGFLLRCLQKSGYFGGDTDFDVEPNEEQYQIGEMLLYNLQMLQFNAHEINEVLYCPTMGIKGVRATYIGVAIYPTVALFNHDCYPAVTRYFNGKSIVIQALRALKPNEAIAENYGPIFSWHTVIERQRSLSGRYWFNCRCRACVEDWPTLKSKEIDNFPKRIKFIFKAKNTYRLS